MNYRFSLDEWLPRFPLDPNATRYSGESITGPTEICNNELLRREMQDQYTWGPAVPVDLFVMAEGEPENRHATKVSGLPYRPATAKWPMTEQGHPMMFLAQFNFCDSQDLTGDLPGDLLLVFADYSNQWIESLEFEWQRFGLDDLVSAEAVPTILDAFNPCYGHILRAASFPQAKRIVSRKNQKYPKCLGKDVWSDYHLLQYQAMQIGTAPFFIQGNPELPGLPLCTISSVQPDQHTPYPWINHPDPLLPEDEWNFETNDLMIVDSGCIYISLDDEQQIHWDLSSF